ncbi:hypothetical protein [Micromonospora coerulea]|uniref:hypothetical protein n=1 Tax=Micromonospora coerulea TaxID=47856 RepID=UPI001903ABB6|nr:hypothetical protein [Micromonospora veneta]
MAWRLQILAARHGQDGHLQAGQVGRRVVGHELSEPAGVDPGAAEASDVGGSGAHFLLVAGEFRDQVDPEAPEQGPYRRLEVTGARSACQRRTTAPDRSVGDKVLNRINPRWYGRQG